MTLLNDYDLEKNIFGICEETLAIVKKLQVLSQGLQHADSVTIDFHKLGWGHYPSSAFIVNRRDDLQHLFRDKADVPYFCEADVRRDPALFTLECSRPAIGPYSVMATLNGLGLEGCQLLTVHAIDMSRKLKVRLDALENCKVLNMDAMGPSVCWWVLPRGRNAEEIYDLAVSGRLSEEKSTRYFDEIKKMFDRRAADMDPKVDAMLSYTTSIGYCPGGLKLPAWKAVFFNPATDDAVIDQIVKSISELM